MQDCDNLVCTVFSRVINSANPGGSLTQGNLFCGKGQDVWARDRKHSFKLPAVFNTVGRTVVGQFFCVIVNFHSVSISVSLIRFA
jgi:hypothetical protein